jgi:hypothetical protein
MTYGQSGVSQLMCRVKKNQRSIPVKPSLSGKRAFREMGNVLQSIIFFK